jgi:hypothetical protein
LAAIQVVLAARLVLADAGGLLVEAVERTWLGVIEIEGMFDRHPVESATHTAERALPEVADVCCERQADECRAGVLNVGFAVSCSIV